jgi:outer membrane protein OmpA-like peptidoglycan-associated protein
MKGHPMKRLLISTTALAVALSGMTPVPLMAQDKAVECVEGQPCPDDKAAKKAARKAEKEAEKAAEKEAAKAAKKAEREAAKAAEEAAAADAAAQAEAEAAQADAADTATAPQSEDTGGTVLPAPTQTETTDPAPEPTVEGPSETVEIAPEEAPAEAAPAETAAPDAADTDAKAAKKAARKAERQAEKAAETAEPPPEATEALEGILTQTDSAAAPAAAAAFGPGNSEDGSGAATAALQPVGTTQTTLTEADTRSSDEEFTTREQRREQRKKDRKNQETSPESADSDRGLSDFEKFGLLALGALAVGAILKNGDRVVENTGDRVVVARSDGSYQVLKDDDTLIRQPGSTLRTETFADGSTRSTVTRDDGTQVVTIRDAAGRVLRRATYDAQGRELVLIDDLSPVQPIDVTTLPRRPEVTVSSAQDPATLESALAAVRTGGAGAFSLAQVRDLREVRALAPRIEVAPITFATGSAAIDPSEATKLAELGGLVARMVRARPNELFLIEGHTDAVGSAASNLALSDRRAESVALALTEYFDVPPENIVVQGYGEADLLVPTDAAEPRNRRVAVRVITPLLAAAR